MLLIGRGSREFRSRLLARHPSLADRITATGTLDPTATAEHLAACDMLVQPYPDGVTTRRGSVMAGLALGAAVVTNVGELTEALWAETGAVSLARGADPSGIIGCADALIRDPARRHALSQRARALYRERFAVERTVEILRALS
jgi:glycosyltransferase involved in cell wall biosynthesis